MSETETCTEATTGNEAATSPSAESVDTASLSVMAEIAQLARQEGKAFMQQSMLTRRRPERRRYKHMATAMFAFGLYLEDLATGEPDDVDAD